MINYKTKKRNPQADLLTVEFKLVSPEPYDIAIQIGKADLEGKKHPEKEKLEIKHDQNQAKAQTRAKLMMALGAMVNTVLALFGR